MRRPWAFGLGLPLLAVLASGCGASNRVGGAVTYEGQPIEKGQILFLPSDGQGPAVGGAIVHGQYAVENPTPGPNAVQIVAALESAPPVTSLEEIARRGPGGAASSDRSPNVVPANAEGNNVTVEVKAGENVLNFDLKKPTGATRPGR